MSELKVFRRGSQIRLQLSTAGPTNRPQLKVIKQWIKLKLRPAAGSEAKAAAEFGCRPLHFFSRNKTSKNEIQMKSEHKVVFPKNNENAVFFSFCIQPTTYFIWSAVKLYAYQ